MNFENKKNTLGLFSLIMIAIVSVDSLRNLPIGAQYGFSLITFYLLAAITFFIPLTWIASKLTTGFPKTGGSYLWVEAAFGKSFAYLSIWLQWVYNIIWYPTIFAFISSTVASLLFPNFANNKWYLFLTCLSLFWILTFVHFRGVRAIAWVSAASAIVGTILPMLLIMALACYWLASGQPSATPLTMDALLPNKETFKDIAYFSNILFSLLGIEVIAMHAGNVTNPKTAYPRAFIISAMIILFTLVLSSLALCVVIAPGKLMLISGVMDVFHLFFATYHFPYGAQIIGWCIVLGGFGIASSWMIGLARGLHVALTSTRAPKFLHKLNKHGVPLNVLCLQGVVYTILLSAFILMPNVNNSYWLLSALTSQFALLYYILLFAASFKLLSKMEDRSACTNVLRVLFPVSGIIISIAGITAGFIPPSDVAADNILQYKIFMGIGLVVFCLVPFFVGRMKRG